MKYTRIMLALIFLLVGCTAGGPKATAGAGASPSPSLPTVAPQTTRTPDPKTAAKSFLEAWQADDYSKMYGMLTKVSQDALSQEDFTKRYTEAAQSLTLKQLDFEVLSSLLNPANAQVAYRVTFHTNLLGDQDRQTAMNLVLENGEWRIQWEDAMIMPELKGGNHLALDIKVPARGNIYDRSGHALASQADAVALGMIPAEIDDSQADAVISELSRLTGKTPESIRAQYEKAAGMDWYIAVGEASAQDVDARMDVLSGLGGLILNPFRARYYNDGGVAPHVVGYVQPIFAEELDAYKRKGYRGDEKVGSAGLEKWGEQYLAGQHGGTLHVTDPQGNITTTLASVNPQPAQSIYTTLDLDLQLQAQKAIQGFTGAIVVLERDTGRVLAMVSSPGFDSNLFEPTNYNTGYTTAAIDQFNRATQGTYPLGSVFKIITMAAALESGKYQWDTTYDCQLTFTELPGEPLTDWTYEKGYDPSGVLTLQEGLMRSCNPYFYHIGLDLFRNQSGTYLSDMARKFGLGSPTGIEQVAEDAGNVPNPETDDQAVRMAIGQDQLLVTPLQVADFVAAVGNGGTLYRPQVIEKIAPVDGDPSYSLTPEVRGQLPVSSDNLKIIQEAMRMVVNNKRGTAFDIFTGMQIPVYGKTGTAQTSGDSHAWFAGYTDAQREDQPDIAIAVIAENAGEGSEIAAPIFRRIVEDYFLGQPSRLYPWESGYYVTQTPTPLYTETPAPAEETATPEATAAP